MMTPKVALLTMGMMTPTLKVVLLTMMAAITRTTNLTSIIIGLADDDDDDASDNETNTATATTNGETTTTITPLNKKPHNKNHLPPPMKRSRNKLPRHDYLDCPINRSSNTLLHAFCEPIPPRHLKRHHPIQHIHIQR
jgi:hypothetical protein